MWQLCGPWMWEMMLWSYRKSTSESGVVLFVVVFFVFAFSAHFFGLSNHEILVRGQKKGLLKKKWQSSPLTEWFLVESIRKKPFIVALKQVTHKKICIHLPHSQTMKRVLEEAIAKSGIIHHSCSASAPAWWGISSGNQGYRQCGA